MIKFNNKKPIENKLFFINKSRNTYNNKEARFFQEQSFHCKTNLQEKNHFTDLQETIYMNKLIITQYIKQFNLIFFPRDVQQYEIRLKINDSLTKKNCKFSCRYIICSSLS